MKQPVKLSFPGGAGGHWLSNLIHRLENNSDIDIVRTKGQHHHRLVHSRNLRVTHNYYTDDNTIRYNGFKTFNIFLNVATKNHDACYSANSEAEYLVLYAHSVSSTIEYPNDAIDLNHDLIFIDPDSFTKDLYSILDRHNFSYTKNDDLIKTAIKNYRISCPNPRDYFGDWDNLLWLGWCYGVMKLETWTIISEVNELQDLLYKDKNYYLDFTQSRMVNNDIT